jgi:glucosamine-6-phosphate isomerase
MELKIYEDHTALSAAAANEIIGLLKARPDAVICMASGETPRLTCQMVVEQARKEQTDLRRCTFVGLDEWVGIPPSNTGSCNYFFHHELITALRFSPAQVLLFDAMADDLQAECKKMDEAIADKGGIDLMIVGIGMNGHIGFNEPGVDQQLGSHVADLEETTISVGQKYFQGETRLTKGITLGFKHLKNARKVWMLANGKKKADVVSAAINGPVSPAFPASIFQTLNNAVIAVDKEAAGKLK